jgi:hypothetical protein
MALRKPLILRRLRSGRLEGRTTLVQPDFDFFTRSSAGVPRNFGLIYSDQFTA